MTVSVFEDRGSHIEVYIHKENEKYSTNISRIILLRFKERTI